MSKSIYWERAARIALFILLLSVVGITNVLAQSFTVGNLNYSVNDDGVSVTVTGHVNGEDATGELVIPGTVVNNGISYTVTAIGDYAFTGCSGFTGNLSIPNSVISIGSYAFIGCSGFTGSLIIPTSVTSIGIYAFYYCSGFTGNLSIPNSVTSIGSFAFYGCSGFTGSLTFSNSLTEIEYYVFGLCYGLTSIEIPYSVTSIGEGAFSYCYGLTSIEIPYSVTSMGSYVFYYCSGLQSLTVLPETPPTLDEYVFEGVNMDIPVFVPCGMKDVYVNEGWGGFSNFDGMCPGEITVMANPAEGGTVSGGGTYDFGTSCTVTATANGGYAFANWTIDSRVVSTNAEYTFPVTGMVTLVANFVSAGNIVFADDNVKAICVANWDTNGDGELSYAEAAAVTDLGGVFQYHSEITSFDELQYFISLVSIGENAFIFCSNMTSIILPNSLASIGWRAFYYCPSLTSVTIPNSVTSIGSSAFPYCYGLESLIVESGNTVYDSREGCNAIITTASNTLIVGCKNTTIPNTVTSIGESAFYGCYDLSSIEIPNSVTSIGNGAFGVCDGLTSITFSNSLTFIGWGAFSFCFSLTSVTIPNSVNFIEFSAFAYCTGLTSIIVEAGNTVYDSREDCNAIIATASNTLIAGCKSTTIPNSVTSIGEYAFYGCDALTSIEIPNSVTSIEYWAFSYCNGLQSMTVLSETPPTLGWEVFPGVNMDIPVFVPCGSEDAYINEGWGSFNNFVGMCPCEVTVMANPAECGTVSGGGIYNIGTYCTLTATANEGYAFVNWTIDGRVVSTNAEYDFFVAGAVTVVANFTSTDNIVFADANVKSICVANWDTNGDGELSYAEAASVTSLGDAFSHNSSISSFDELQYFIGLNFIGYEAFYYCSSLTSIEIPNSVISIESYAFANCTGLTSIEIPNSVTFIGDWAFGECSSLTSIEIPSSVTNIGANPFIVCSGLEQIIVEAGNMVYDSRDNCNAIIDSSTNELISGCKNTVIPNSVTSIGNSAFSHCYSLTSIEIPNSVTSIGDYAFSDCYGLTFIEIPNSVTFIGIFAFSYCRSLISIEIPNSVTFISNSTFYYCPNLISIEIPNSVTSIDNWAFSYCFSLTSIEIPNSVSYIGYYAFGGCYGLQSMTILPETPPTLDGYVFSGVNMDIPVFVPCGRLAVYQSAEGWNEFTNFHELCTQSQTNTLAAGWNWFSTYLDITLDELKTALVEALPNTTISINSQQNGSTIYNGTMWRGTLNTLDVTQMYMIKTGATCEISLTGIPINPIGHPVTIHNGINWIAFPLSESMSLNDVFAGFAVNGDMITSQFGYATYNGSMWRGSLSTLEPNKGYIYRSSVQGDRIFTFPISTK